MSDRTLIAPRDATRHSFTALRTSLDADALRLAEILSAPAEPAVITDLARESFQSSVELKAYRDKIESIENELIRTLDQARSDQCKAQTRMVAAINWVKDYYGGYKEPQPLSNDVADAIAAPLSGSKPTESDLRPHLATLWKYVTANVISFERAPLSDATKISRDGRRNLSRDEIASAIKELRALVAEHQFLSRHENLGMYLAWIAGRDNEQAARDLLAAIDGISGRNSKRGFLKNVLAECIDQINKSQKIIDAALCSLETTKQWTSVWRQALAPVESELLTTEKVAREEAARVALQKQLHDLRDRRIDIAKRSEDFLRTANSSRDCVPNFEIEDAYLNLEDQYRRLITDRLYPLLLESTVARGVFKHFVEPTPDLSLANLFTAFLKVELTEFKELEPGSEKYNLAKIRLAHLLPRVPLKQRRELEMSFNIGSTESPYFDNFIQMLNVKNLRVLNWDEAEAAAEIYS